jgi:hypothetical protein
MLDGRVHLGEIDIALRVGLGGELAAGGDSSRLAGWGGAHIG